MTAGIAFIFHMNQAINFMRKFSNMTLPQGFLFSPLSKLYNAHSQVSAAIQAATNGHKLFKLTLHPILSSSSYNDALVFVSRKVAQSE